MAGLLLAATNPCFERACQLRQQLHQQLHQRQHPSSVRSACAALLNKKVMPGSPVPISPAVTDWRQIARKAATTTASSKVVHLFFEANKALCETADANMGDKNKEKEDPDDLMEEHGEIEPAE
ncbi:unnamed protein product, partial [Polarella glacialis]